MFGELAQSPRVSRMVIFCQILSLGRPESSSRSGRTSRTSSIIAGQISASTTKPGTSVLVASHTLASPSQRAVMTISRFMREKSDVSPARSIPQQLIDRGLGPRLLVYALDDYRAIEAGAGRAVGHRLAWERARHHDRIRRHLALKIFAAGAVDDAGRGADEHAHGEHRALAHDHALGHFRARADEAIVLDDDRRRLQGFEHAADAGAAGNMAVLADLRAGADRGPGVDHGAAVDIGAEIDERGHQHHARRDE